LPLVLVVNPQLQAKTLSEVIALAKIEAGGTQLWYIR
jgi:hypothetical protein